MGYFDDDPNNPALPRPGQQMLAADPMAGMGGGPAPGGRFQIPPALIASLMQQNTGAAGNISRQRKMADQMRQGAGDQMQGRQVGHMYVAPNIANLAASVLGSWRAGQMDKQATGDSGALDTQAAAQGSDWFKRLRDGMGN